MNKLVLTTLMFLSTSLVSAEEAALQRRAPAVGNEVTVTILIPNAVHAGPYVVDVFRRFDLLARMTVPINLQTGRWTYSIASADLRFTEGEILTAFIHGAAGPVNSRVQLVNGRLTVFFELRLRGAIPPAFDIPVSVEDDLSL